MTPAENPAAAAREAVSFAAVRCVLACQQGDAKAASFWSLLAFSAATASNSP